MSRHRSKSHSDSGAFDPRASDIHELRAPAATDLGPGWRELERIAALERQLAEARQHITSLEQRNAWLGHEAPVGHFTLNRQGEVLELNRAGARLLGESRENVLGQPWQHRVARADRARFEQFAEHVRLGSARPAEAQCTVLHADGTRHTLELRGRAAPQVGEIYLVAVEVSAPLVEAPLDDGSLSGPQQVDAMRRAARGVAHDLNNLLTRILCSTELASIVIDDPLQLDQDLMRISAATREAEALVARLMDLARPPADALRTQAGSQSAPVAIAKRRVILVEPDEYLRQTSAVYLARLGYEVLGFASGESALSSGPRADLLVTDVSLAGLSGQALARELTLDQPSLRVLFTSDAVGNLLGPGGVVPAEINFVAKPYSPSELARRVRLRLSAPG